MERTLSEWNLQGLLFETYGKVPLNTPSGPTLGVKRMLRTDIHTQWNWRTEREWWNDDGGPEANGGGEEEMKEERQVARPAVDHVRWIHGFGASGEWASRREAVGSNGFGHTCCTVPRDVMNSNFEEWMKLATDNVSVIFFALRLNSSIRVLLVANRTVFGLSTENQREQFLEFPSNRLFLWHALAAKQRRQLGKLHTRRVREYLDFGRGQRR